MSNTSTLNEFASTLSTVRHPTPKTGAKYAESVTEVANQAPEVSLGSAARRRVTKINKRVLPVLTEAIEFAEYTGNSLVMKAAGFALKAATPPARVRNIETCNNQIRYAAMAVTHVVDGLDEIARGYNDRSEESTEFRREARRLQKRIRNAAFSAMKIAANVRG